jgi:hypothetical protein
MHDNADSVNLERPAPTEMMPVPVTGELIDPRNTEQVMAALLYLREWKREMYDPFIAALEAAIIQHRMDVDARYTVRAGGLVAESTSQAAAHSYQYDGERLRRRLRAAGLPKEEVERAVVREVSYKVNGSRIKALAGHPVYGKIVDECRTEIPKRRGVTVKRDT